jgi:hypothetical protein
MLSGSHRHFEAVSGNGQVLQQSPRKHIYCFASVELLHRHDMQMTYVAVSSFLRSKLYTCVTCELVSSKEESKIYITPTLYLITSTTFEEK